MSAEYILIVAGFSFSVVCMNTFFYDPKIFRQCSGFLTSNIYFMRASYFK